MITAYSVAGSGRRNSVVRPGQLGQAVGVPSASWLGVITGLPGSGKTTLARALSAQRRAVRLCPDDWMSALGVSLWDEAFRDRLERQMLTFAGDALSFGWGVVVEFGSWSRAERDELLRLGRRAGATVELHVLDPRPDEHWRRLSERNRQPSQVVIDSATLASYRQHWQRPTRDEMNAYDDACLHR